LHKQKQFLFCVSQSIFLLMLQRTGASFPAPQIFSSTLSGSKPLLFIKVPNTITLLRFLSTANIHKYNMKTSRSVRWVLILTFIKANHIPPAVSKHVSKCLWTLGPAESEMLKLQIRESGVTKCTSKHSRDASLSQPHNIQVYINSG